MPLKPPLAAFPAAAGSCDLLLTPIHDPEHRQWSRPNGGWTDRFKQYRAPGWQGGRDSYWERPWCRIEATFAAVTPLTTEEQGWQQKKKALVGTPLGALMEAGRRPHVLFGTKELEERRPLVFLPPMLHAQLEEYAADKVLENLTSQSDKGVIERFVAEAKLLQPKLEVGVVELGGGRVRQTLADGSVYEGGFEGGKSHGHGKMVYASGNVYEGGWRDGKRHGHGKYLFANGDVYEGGYEDGKKHGRGKMVYADGDVYEGGWRDDKRHGHGKYLFANGDVYEGGYEGGKRHGRGKKVDADGDVYEGDFEDGKKHGHGKMVYADGDVYEGGWRDDKKHGHGKYLFASGAVYEGGYEGGKRHGRGKKTSPSGEVLQEGEWRVGNFVG